MYQRRPTDKKTPAKIRRIPNRDQAARIFHLMKRVGISQITIARACGVSPTMVRGVMYNLKVSHRVQLQIAVSLGYDSWGELLAHAPRVAA